MTISLPGYDRLNPYLWYDHMRRSAPVSQDASGVWNVFGCNDVQRSLSDHRSFSSERQRVRSENRESALATSLIATDPPRHRPLRSLVEQAFTPRQVRAMGPRIRELVHELLDAAPTGRMDFVRDFAEPLPVIVIAEILGIAAADRHDFKRWSDAVVTGDPSGSREMAGYFARLIERRRAEPGEDLISGLLAATLDGEHLDVQELLGFCMLLLVAGNETTTNLLSNTVLSWHEHPAAHAAVQADRALIPGTVEEVLRYRSPVQSMFRVTDCEVELGGVLIPENSPVRAWIGSANRDPAQFESPDSFDPARSPNRHLAFGNGIHFCLGAPLARLEAATALEAMLDRLPHLRVLPGTLHPIESQVVCGVKSLPVSH